MSSDQEGTGDPALLQCHPACLLGHVSKGNCPLMLYLDAVLWQKTELRNIMTQVQDLGVSWGARSVDCMVVHHVKTGGSIHSIFRDILERKDCRSSLVPCYGKKVFIHVYASVSTAQCPLKRGTHHSLLYSILRKFGLTMSQKTVG